MIVGGALIVREVLRRYGLDEIEFSVRDLLDGAALAAADLPGPGRGRRAARRLHVLLKSAALLVAVAALAGCGGSSKETAPTTTAQASTLPPGCSVAEVDRIVTSFLAHPQLAPPSFFELYAAYESDGRKFVSKKRAVALAHLRARGRRGERARLLSLRVSNQDINHARITFSLTRFAPDFRAAASTPVWRRAAARSTAPTAWSRPG